MAARSGGGTGMVVAVVILGVLTLGLFVTSVVFFSQKQAAERQYTQLVTDSKDIVRENERQQDFVGQYKVAAKADGGKSVVKYLDDTIAAIMEKAAGSKKLTVKEFNERVGKVEGGGASDLLGIIRAKDDQLATFKSRAEEAEAARARAQEDRQNEAKRVGEIETKQRETLAALNGEVDKYKGEVEQYREELNAAKARMDQEIDKTREAARAREAELLGQIRESQEKQAIATETVKRLQEQLRGKTFEVGKEYALVDGEVIGLDSAEGHLFLNLGRKQKAVLGMTFEVYSESSSIRPDPKTGDYPAGKATVEVIKVDEASSTCRIVREKKGNPVVKGDVIANAIYDPKKVYKFLAYGNFDTNGDGRATPQEQADVEALIREWGGIVVTELGGDVDFLVLGQKPTLGPPPPSTAPPAIVQEHVRQRQIVDQYARLFDQAVATSIPIINENRLRTLTGLGYRR